MIGIAGDTAVSGIDHALLAVGTFLASYGHAGTARLAELAKVAVAGFTKPFDEPACFLPAGWVAAMSRLWWLDQYAGSAIGILMVVAYLA